MLGKTVHLFLANLKQCFQEISQMICGKPERQNPAELSAGSCHFLRLPSVFASPLRSPHGCFLPPGSWATTIQVAFLCQHWPGTLRLAFSPSCVLTCAPERVHHFSREDCWALLGVSASHLGGPVFDSQLRSNSSFLLMCFLGRQQVKAAYRPR